MRLLNVLVRTDERLKTCFSRQYGELVMRIRTNFFVIPAVFKKHTSLINSKGLAGPEVSKAMTNFAY